MTRPRFNTTWVEPGKFLAGSIPTSAQNIEQLKSSGVQAILTLTMRDIRDCPEIARAMDGIAYCHSPIPDCGIPTDDILERALRFIRAHNDIPVYVHCRGGIGRTGCILIAHYVLDKGKSVQEALDIVRVRRNIEGNATAADHGNSQMPWIEALPERLKMNEPKQPAKRGRKPKQQEPVIVVEPKVIAESPSIPGALYLTLEKIASDYGLDAAILAQYAMEDGLKGNDDGNPYGTSFTVEGQLIYALVRDLKPRRILEIGTYHGGGTSHLALACERNGQGEVVTVDIDPALGQYVIPEAKRRVTQIYANADLWALTEVGIFDFIFEDGSHSEHQVHTIWAQLPRILAPGGWILTHDIATGVGQYIRNGIVKGGVKLSEVHSYLTSPSPCGMGIWRKP